jgi:hypothetical protein
MSVIGEVTWSSTTRVRALAREVFEPPAFGSFVRVDSSRGHVYGVVARVETGSFGDQRRAIAFGLPWEELARQQPQLVELLQTEFEVAVIGYGGNGSLHHYLPPYPPRVHEFVSPCDPTEVAALTDSLEFIRTLAALEEGVPVHELVAAAIREASAARGGDAAFVAEAARTVADLFKDDYEAAMAVVRRIGP